MVPILHPLNENRYYISWTEFKHPPVYDEIVEPVHGVPKGRTGDLSLTNPQLGLNE